MTTTRATSDSSSSWRELDRLLEEYTARVQRGEPISPESFVAEHPEHAGELADILRGLAAVTDASSRPGTLERVGEFRIVRELGRGGMGVVYEAVQESLGRRVALKTLPRLDAHHRERFDREARAAGGLDHPGIVAVHDFGEQDGRPWCAMQLVEGCSLERVIAALRAQRGHTTAEQGGEASAARIALRLDRGAGPSEPAGDASQTYPSRADVYTRSAARMLLQAAEAVAYAHSRGVLHRDLKPSNLLVDHDVRVRVADFGLCKLVGAESLSATGELIGTLRYMAPEQLSGIADARTDVHALGLILHELLTLQPAYASSERGDLVHQILYEAPERLRRIDATIRVDLETIASKATAKLPDERYPTAAAMAQDLAAFLAGKPISARPPSAVYLARLALRRWRIPVALLVAVGFVLALSTALYVRGLREAERARARQAYAAQLSAARAALADGDVALARRHLEETPPELRRWEWEHLVRCQDESLERVWVDDGLPHTLALSPDGSLLAVGGSRRVVVLGMPEVIELSEVATTTECWLAWAPDGRRLAIGDWTPRMRIADFGVDPPAVIERPLESVVRAVAIDPTGTRVACAGRDGTIRVFSDDLERELAVLRGHSANVDRLHFVSERELVSSWDGTVRLWNVEDGSTRTLDAGGTAVIGLAVAPGPKLWASGDFAGTLRIGGIEGDALTRTRPGHRARVRAVAFDPQGELLVSAAEDNTLRLWSERGEIDVLHGHQGAVTDVAFHPDGQRFFSVSPAGAVLAWDVYGARGDARLLGHQGDVWSAVFTRDGRRLVTGSSDQTARVWDLDTRRSWRVLTGTTGTPQCLDVDADGMRVIGGCKDGSIWSWSLVDARGRELVAPGGPAAQGCAFVDADRHILVARADGTVELIDGDAGTLLSSIEFEAGELRDFAIDRERGRLAVGFADGRIGLAEVGAHEPSGWLEGHEDKTMALAFSPDGRLLASVGNDHKLRMWEVDRRVPWGWAELACTEPGARNVFPSNVAFHPDGKRLATSALDGSLRVWDVDTGAVLLTLRAHEAWANVVAFDPTGTHLMSGGTGGGLRLWSAGSEVASARPNARRAELSERVERAIERLGTPAAYVEELRLAGGLEQPERDTLLALALEQLGSAKWLLDEVRRIAADPDRSQPQYDRAWNIAYSIHRARDADPLAGAALGMLACRLDRPGSARDWLGRTEHAEGVAEDALALSFHVIACTRTGDLEGARERLARAERAPDARAWAAVLDEARAVLAAASE